MHTPSRERVGGYSDFFSSGFRAISSGNVSSHSRRSSTYFLPSIPSNLIRSISVTSRRRSTDGENERHSPSPPTENWRRREESQSNISTPEKRKKRSSLIEFSTKVLDKMTPGTPEARSFMEFDETRRRLRPSSRNDSPELTKLGMSGSILGTNVSSIRTSYPDSNEIDPFNPSPHSKSFFIDLSDSSSFLTTSSSSPKRSRHQSFISFSGSSLSSLTNFTRRERPASIHSLPAADLISSGPTRPRHPLSRNSSYPPPPSSNLDKVDFALPEESSVPESPHENGDRDLANIDWREFHVQLFDNA